MRRATTCCWLTLFFLAFGAGPVITAAQEQGAANADRSETKEAVAKVDQDVTQGALRVERPQGGIVECPLKHTDVQADVSGFIARVTVTQTFANPFEEKIEATYVFPLPHEAAVDAMTMVIGERKIVGQIKRREEARDIYEQAVQSGQTAALLEQERPNIFTQSVGNIEPGQEVLIKISYVDVLRYDVGSYEFHFPMVVGPRFIPGSPTSSPKGVPNELSGKVSPPVPDTTRVPDASRISPPVLKPGFRTGHDISLSVHVDAGVPVQGMKVVNHKADIQKDGDSRATVKLDSADAIANKDFVLRYDVVGEKPEMAVLAHTGNYRDSRRLGEGYFMLMIQPQEDERLKKSPPREVVFLVDVSGSMRGKPTQKVIEAMDHMLRLCREKDTVQVITFASQTSSLFEKPVPVNQENIAKALNFTQNVRGSGGTHMLQGVQRAIDQPIDKERLRIVVMLTDGYIGNEAEIIKHVGKHCGDRIRFWAIGVGSSPNMFLIDGVARQGGGMGKKLNLADDTEALTQEVMTRIQRAQLADIKIDWGDFEIAETYPTRLPELWAGRPVILFGRYRGGGKSAISVSGNVEGEPVNWPLEVSLPKSQRDHDVLAKVWARKKIEDLMHQSYYEGDPAVEESVTALALDYRLMSQYTSFVAVDASKPPQPNARPPRQALVPVPLPQGAQWEGFFGPLGEGERLNELAIGESLLGVKKSASFGRAVRVRQRAAATPLPRQYRRFNGPSPVTEGAMPASQRGHYWSFEFQPSPTSRMKQTFERKSSNARGLGLNYQGGRASGGMPGAPAPQTHTMLFAKPRIADFGAAELDGLAVADRQTQIALQSDAGEQLKFAQSMLESAKEAIEKKKNAKDLLTRAYCWGVAASQRGHGGQVAAEALALLRSVRDAEIAAWSKNLPALEKRLDLILRDRSLEEAIEAVAKAADLKVTILEGSKEDAAAALDAQPRVNFLDLRHATVAQALEWIALPARLTWRVNGDDVTVGSARRLPGEDAWIYDVSVLALPSTEDLAKQGDYQKGLAAARKEAEEFLAAVHQSFEIDDTQADWFAPGQIVIFGNPQLHDKAARLFTNLADPQAKVDESLAAFHEKTSERATSRAVHLDKVKAARKAMEMAATHEGFGWSLLASAAGGELDLEALTELQIAWRDPQTDKLLGGKSSGVVLRSLWIVRESARLLPDEDELRNLADVALDKSRPAAEKALLEAKENADAIAKLAYSALALQDDEFSRQTLRVLKDVNAEAPHFNLAVVAKALLSPADEIDSRSLMEIIEGGEIRADDMIALTALACRRAGGDVWTAFRAERGDLLGSQPLVGSVVVFVNRLSGKGVQVATR